MTETIYVSYTNSVWVARVPFSRNNDLRDSEWEFHKNGCKKKKCKGCQYKVPAGRWFTAYWDESVTLQHFDSVAFDDEARFATEFENHHKYVRQVVDELQAGAVSLPVLEQPNPDGFVYVPAPICVALQLTQYMLTPTCLLLPEDLELVRSALIRWIQTRQMSERGLAWVHFLVSDISRKLTSTSRPEILS